MNKIIDKHDLSDDLLEEIKIASMVIPFRTNEYVIDELIDWEQVPNDPIFNLNFPQKSMLKYNHYKKLQTAIIEDYSPNKIETIKEEIYKDLNPHPGGQICYNTPEMNGRKLTGIQHKYRETVVCFPSEGQMCHAFCTYCFRWAQFIGKNDLKMSLNNPQFLIDYLQNHPEVQEVLFTGGDPLIMKANKISKYIIPILEAEIKHLKSIRFGTKTLTYWPFRYVSDSDSEEILDIFKKIVDSKIHLSIVANFNHPKELKTDILKAAVKKVQSTGAIIRTQSPILNNINADKEIWIELIRKEVDLGMVPYYMFIPRDTGAKEYFEVPLVDAFRIYIKAIRKLSGLCRTIRGPVMSTTPGKIQVVGITSIQNHRVMALKFIQGRNPRWVGRIFFAKFNRKATWLNDLEPALAKKFFYEHELIKYLHPYGSSQIDKVAEKNLESEEITGET